MQSGRLTDMRWRGTRLRAAGAVCAIAVAALCAVGGGVAGAADTDATTGPATVATSDAERALASGGGITITEVDASRFPTVRVAFGAQKVDGTAPKLGFFENGGAQSGVHLYNGAMGSYEDQVRADVMLVFDASYSMNEGDRLTAAVAAARELIDQANTGDRIGLATFGAQAKVILKPTEDHARVERALDDIQLSNATRMFDAVEKASQAFDPNAKQARRAIVLLSDGTDLGSFASVDDAAGAALKANAPIFSVAIRENVKDQPADLAKLGNGTGGELRTVAGTAGLDTLFAELGRRILQPYWVEYRSDAPDKSQVEFGIAAGGAGSGVDASTKFRAARPDSLSDGAPSEYVAPQKAAPATPAVSLPDGPLGIAIVTVPFALLVFFLVYMFLAKRSRPDVLARIERYAARASADPSENRAQQKERVSIVRRIAQPFMNISDSFLGKSAFFERTRVRAEQAAIAIKPAELFTAMLGAGTFGLIIAIMFGAKPLLFLLLVPTFSFIPNLWLRMRARKRKRAFEDQLPDVLGGLASSLNAGHSFNQALNAMIKDAPNPTSEEFQRVMTEARLGMPTEEALQHMADRMGSDDFEFAVTTVNIQRTVGGSLADILEMVGDTVRNRQQFRKKVKALTSMGQMSAYVLLGMPIFIGCILGVMSPQYIAPLFTTSAGHFMLAAGCMSMLLGYVFCMKIVRVKV